MFGTTKRLDEMSERFDDIERSIRNTLHDKDWRIQQLEREIESLKSWGAKWREKAKFFRRANRELKEKGST